MRTSLFQIEKVKNGLQQVFCYTGWDQMSSSSNTWEKGKNQKEWIKYFLKVKMDALKYNTDFEVGIL